jgi:class 3 adenylate cyclase
MRADRARDDRATVRTTGLILGSDRVRRDSCITAEAYAFRSASLTQLGELDSALFTAQRALAFFPSRCDSTVVMRAFLATTLIDLKMGRFQQVDSLCVKILGRWNDNWDAPGVRRSLITNSAIARANMGDMDGAQAAFRDALRYSLRANDGFDIDEALGNLGTLKYMIGDPDSAEFFWREALRNNIAHGFTKRIARKYANLTGPAEDRGYYKKALALYDSAEVFARAAGDVDLLVRIEKGYAWNLGQLGRHKEAMEHFELHEMYKDSLLNIEKVRSMADMQEKYESEKKAREITGLKADKLSAALDRLQLQRIRNIYLFTALIILVLAGALWGRLRLTQRARRAIQKEKDVSEGLLLNILPEEVAAELKLNGAAEARQFDQATVLFTDFKGFTALSEQLTPVELVAEIHHCFKAFDGIVEARHIEKIKTIGDAYMAAGGLPDTAYGGPAEVVLAALEMQEFMADYAAQRRSQARPYFEMRVGVHTGPVIAGIVGVKKFAYDIWGDTVNTASRMESSGAVGCVNVSGATYELLKADTRFSFEARGLVAAKGKGEMQMYFARRAADV